MEGSLVAISIAEAGKIIHSLYGIQVQCIALAGELDVNFKATTKEGDAFVLKISRANASLDTLNFQNSLLGALSNSKDGLTVPKVIPTLDNQLMGSYTDTAGNERWIRLLTWLPGTLWSAVNPHQAETHYSLGNTLGKLAMALKNVEHPYAHRSLAWDTAQSLWTKEKLHLFQGSEQKLVAQAIDSFENSLESYEQLPKQIIHNDANDNNILLSGPPNQRTVDALIDFGDAIYTQRINDLGIACAYASKDAREPLRKVLPIVKGYHDGYPLTEEELVHLFNAIQMRLVTTVTKAAMNRTIEPENQYHFISERAAWKALEAWSLVSPEFALIRFRESCDFLPHPQQAAFDTWVESIPSSLQTLFPTINKKEVFPLDLSVSSNWLGNQMDFNNLDWFQFQIDQLQLKAKEQIIAGGYLEPRALYTDDSFDTEGDHGKQNRSIHLGVDFWLAAGTPVHSLFDGEIVTATYQEQHKNYGGLIIIAHQEAGITFYTLYGHLSKASSSQHPVGTSVKKGDRIGYLGTPLENGAWAPHLHFQVQLTLLHYKNDFPGVSFYHQLKSWKSICPDPMRLFGIDTLSSLPKPDEGKEALLRFRQQHVGRGMSLQYEDPLHIVRGSGPYLIDSVGRKYLDTINNVAHVGHEHPEVVKAGRDQISILNTNSRYLHKNMVTFSQALLDTLPPELSVLHFVNSGSEANELALRMARTMTDSEEVIASEMGYHGNTNLTVAISSYKFDGKGGAGKPEHTHIFPLPDAFRGKHSGSHAGTAYLNEVTKCIDHIHLQNKKVGAFIIESIISCGGQIELPLGFLKAAFKQIRKAGGVCISDEVQTGVGRVGEAFWGFELHDVIPDIVTIGKPIGNGHPLAVVACTPAVADAFANGMEFFNTFGGNPVSCAIGKSVLDIVKRESLQKHALEVGNAFKKGLIALAQQFTIIGDVRGKGLFLGFELVDAHLNPLAHQATYLINRMKAHHILMSTDGPDHNVIKIKPPLVITHEQVATILRCLDKILREEPMQFP